MVEITKKEYMEKGKELYGEDINKWKFKCSGCGKIQSVESIRLQMENEIPSKRYGILKKGDPIGLDSSCYQNDCNWSANGLFCSGILIIFDENKPYNGNLKKNCHYVFNFADYDFLKKNG